MKKDDFAHRAAQWDSPEKIKMTDKFVGAMLKEIEPQKHWKVLEIGAGTGLVGLQILPNVKSVVFEDTSEAMLGVLTQKLKGNETVEILHGHVFDYTKQDIDLIFSCMAFHHIPDIDKTLEHLFTITNAGATVVVGDLVTEDGSFHGFEPIPHCGFDTDSLAKQFSEAGFEVQTNRVYNVLARKNDENEVNNYEQFILIAKKK